MHPDVNTSDACFSSHLLLKMFSFASIEFTSFTRRTLQFEIQLRMHGIEDIEVIEDIAVWNPI